MGGRGTVWLFALGAATAFLLPGASAGAPPGAALPDPRFETLGSPGSPWTLAGCEAAAEDGSVRIASREGVGSLYAACALPEDAAGRALRASALCEAGPAGDAWLSLQFHDSLGRLIGHARGAGAVRGRESHLEVISHIPAGCARASLCLVVSRTTARFRGLDCRLPPGPRSAASYSSRVLGRSSARGPRGLGLLVPFGEEPRSNARLPWVRLRLELPWADIGRGSARPGPTTLRHVESWLAATAEVACPVDLALMEPDASDYADEDRCCECIRALVEACHALPGGERIGAVATAVGAEPEGWERCARALASRLPSGVLLSGPDEWFFGEGAEERASLVGASGGRPTARLSLARRDLEFAQSDLARRAERGVGECVLSVVEQDPDRTDYAGSRAEVLDWAWLAVTAEAAGVPVSLATAGTPLPPSLVQALSTGESAGCRLRTEGGREVAVAWREAGGGLSRIVIVNRSRTALPFELDATAVASRALRLDRTAYRARDGFAPSQTSSVRLIDGRLVDLLDSEAVIVLHRP